MNPMFKAVCAAGALALLILLPTPLLPSPALLKAVEDVFGLGLEPAYLLTVVGVQITFYVLIGMLSALAVKRAATVRGRVFQIAILPGAVIGLALIIRSAKAGHFPNYTNAAVPLVACMIGTGLGLGLLYQRVKTAAVLILVILAAVTAALFDGTSSSLRHLTEAHLQAIVDAGAHLPRGEDRFGALLQVAFRPVANDPQGDDAVEQNRASILAWAIAVGHPRVARLVGFDTGTELVNQAAAIGNEATLRGRPDWSRHYAVSAGLAVLGHRWVSDAGGLMKEQLDALTQGSGFSFGDLAADRAGVRFAKVATSSNEAARIMQERIRGRYDLDDFFPLRSEFPENLSLTEFRHDFGGVGSSRYNLEVSKIDAQLNRCAALLSAP